MAAARLLPFPSAASLSREFGPALQIDPRAVSDKEFWAAQDLVSRETDSLPGEFPTLGLRFETWETQNGYPVTQIFAGGELVLNVVVGVELFDDGPRSYIFVRSLRRFKGRLFRVPEFGLVPCELRMILKARFAREVLAKRAN